MLFEHRVPDFTFQLNKSKVNKFDKGRCTGHVAGFILLFWSSQRSLCAMNR